MATALNNLAGMYRSAGEYHKAQKLYERSLQIRKSHFGLKSPLVEVVEKRLKKLISQIAENESADTIFGQAKRSRKKDDSGNSWKADLAVTLSTLPPIF